MNEHFVSESCGGEHCSICGSKATHKVGEEMAHDDPTAFQIVLGAKSPIRHEFTAYVCCKHFRQIFGPAVPCEVLSHEQD